MEREIKIPISSTKLLYGVLRGPLRSPLVIFVHGLTGDKNEHQFFNGARFLQRHGFSSFRFNLYGWQKNTRKMHQCTLKTHAFDLDRVISYFRGKGIKNVFVVGHSYGGKTILMSKKKDFDAAVLWDPSYGSSAISSGVHYIKSLNGFLELDETPYGYLLGKEMVREAKRSLVEGRIRDLRVPVKIIAAGKGILVRGSKWYYRAANKPKSLVIIQNATHCFDEEGAEEKLFEETLDWFQKFK